MKLGKKKKVYANWIVEAYTQRNWAAFRTAVSFRFFQWLKDNVEVFSLYKASLGFIRCSIFV
ncbi:hypothetical protein GM3708_2211 [Geminocystis sp. NIES-3708]|nr:hypothetical protein GM3708_2211 [Geminocystis sp. NIES-3708]